MTNKLRVFVLYHHGQRADLWPQLLAAGTVQDPSPYGYAYVADEVDFVFSHDHPESQPGATIRKGAKYLVGFDLVHAYRNRKAMASAQMVWTHTEKEHLAVAVLKYLGLVPRHVPVLANSVWLWADFPQASRLRRWALRRLLATHAVHSVEAADGAVVGTRELGAPVVLLPFGIEPYDSLPAPPRRQRPLVVAPGNDRDRDWTLLGQVARRRPDWDFLVLSHRRQAQRLAEIGNVTVRVAGEGGMRQEFADADVMLILCQDNPHASGATTVLQSLSSERPVVVTNTGGVDLYGGTSALYAALGDAEDVEQQLERALERRGDTEALAAGRRSVEERGLDERTYARRHLLATRDVLAGRQVRESVSQTRRLDDEQ